VPLRSWPARLTAPAQCLGGPALATICRMQAEDYGGTGGGVPDLFLWRVADQSAKFVEVKSPNDKPSEKQKVRPPVPALRPRLTGMTPGMDGRDGARGY
jgi:hypothetical protein